MEPTKPDSLPNSTSVNTILVIEKQYKQLSAHKKAQIILSIIKEPNTPKKLKQD